MSQELAAQKRVCNESSGRNSALLSSEGGAPLRRGPRGLFTQLRTWVTTPEVKVWALPLMRVCGMMGVLGCVAFLGKKSEEESIYGAPIAIPATQVGAGARDGTEGQESGQKAEVGLTQSALAQTKPSSSVAPPCSEKKDVSGTSGILPDGRIIMNEATASDFTRLPGVGDARAAKIIELRTRMGKFKQVADLLRVRGIGWKTLQSMKEQLVVDRPVEKPDPKSEKEDQPPSQKGGEAAPSSS